MTTSDARLAASVASDEIRPTYMIAAHRLLQAAEVAVEDGSASPELVEAVRSLRAVYPTPG